MMDDEGRIRDGLERLASEVPTTTRHPVRFRTRARWRMARTSAVATIAIVAVAAGGLVAGQAVARSPSTPGEGVTPTGPAPATTPGLSFTSHIAFQSDRSGNEDVWIMDADGSNLRDLTNDPARDLTPAWSPDGSKIAFVSDRTGNLDIWVMNADGSAPVDLTNSPTDEADPAWSPDGSRIAYTAGPPDGNLQVWVMDAGGTDRHEVVEGPDGARRPAWSPDGSRIAYSSFHVTRSGSVEARISVIGAAGAGARSLTSGSRDSDPSWCPEGDPIVFARQGPDPGDGGAAPVDLYAVRRDGSGMNSLTADGGSSDPSWVPNGTEIVFVRSAARAKEGHTDGDIYLLPYGGSATQLTSGPADDRSPAWQPP
jgi:Tol biopolymer transport system component